ncbi:MAG: hypothetical protein L0387_38670 [Acidobacteria bacterium]|nr:hypothetical protein [Acidobacteriota bacterium]MCI0721674.1 hypothetical protein [Acidobacteriota bacterium]
MQLTQESRQEVVRENRHLSPDRLEKPGAPGPEDPDKAVRDLNTAESKDSRKLAKERQGFSALTQQIALNAVAGQKELGNDLHSVGRVYETLTHTLAGKSVALATPTLRASTLERTEHSRTVEQTKGDLMGPGRSKEKAVIKDLNLRATQEPELRKPTLEVTNSDFDALKGGSQLSINGQAPRPNSNAKGSLALATVVGWVARELDREL